MERVADIVVLAWSQTMLAYSAAHPALRRFFLVGFVGYAMLLPVVSVLRRMVFNHD